RPPYALYLHAIDPLYLLLSLHDALPICRVDVLPLLRDAGEAIVEYLRIRRPVPPGGAAVFLSARAPMQPMRKSSETLLRLRAARSEEHTSELQSRGHLVCRLLLDKKNT